ncbi:MAG: hypothetical protein GC152_14845 [Alphaproteobacteria bacterium]|nr:hypothetical protein [Alphaproteobacteria bacterium]
MVATLILHARADLDWATALASELAEHAPVRLQLAASPPKATIGPSVVRIALWSEDAALEGTAATLAKLITAEPAHSVLVRRGGCPAPAGIDATALAGDIAVDSAREAAAALRASIPRVGAQVAEIVKSERMRVETQKERMYRRADTALLLLVIGVVAALALWQDWGGVRTGLLGGR